MKGQERYRQAKQIIPGGTQLLSKRPELYLPERWPAYYARAKGVEVWDLDGNRFIDMMSTAIGGCPLGFADDDVNAAVKTAIDLGSATSLNCHEEVDLAELLVELHPWAEMVRFGRSGGEAMAIAVRIARAATGRDCVAICGYHGWHDWYLAANLASDTALDGHLLPGLSPAGVPRALAGTTLPFHFGNDAELDGILRAHGTELAAVVMEPVRYEDPQPGYLESVKRRAHAAGAVFVLDEITAAWRTNLGGSHLRLGVVPDVAVFAKALGNGFPIAAIVGTRAVMDAAQKTFISSTNWTERTGPAAALSTIQKMRATNAQHTMIAMGTRVQQVWRDAATEYDLRIEVHGLPPLTGFGFEKDTTAVLATLFTQEMLERGFLACPSFYATSAHTNAHVDSYAAACRAAFASVRAALASGEPESKLKGPVAHRGFARLT